MVKNGNGDEIMSVRLNVKDLELIKFLRTYKQMKAIDCKKIYRSKDYYLKRLKVLEKERYIKRENRYYIKVDIEGRRLLNDLCYENYNLCRNKDYQDRIKDIAKVAMLGLDSDIEFIPSWELKDKHVYTDLGRKYIGELKYMGKKCIAYYISNRNNPIYARQIATDIDKMFSYDNVIVFIEDFNMINKGNKYFMLGKNSLELIRPSEENLELMRLFESIDLYEVLKLIYKGKEILLSDWDKADYMTEENLYIFLMPFVDTVKLHKLNVFYKSSTGSSKKIDIVTLKENRDIIDKVLKRKTNIVELDEWLKKLQIEMEDYLCPK